MTGRENIIKNLEICASGCCEGCTYYKPCGMNLGCWNKLMSDAAKLLKEQEPKTMELCNGELYCPSCGEKLKSYYHYCNECGQAVKWE